MTAMFQSWYLDICHLAPEKKKPLKVGFFFKFFLGKGNLEVTNAFEK